MIVLYDAAGVIVDAVPLTVEGEAQPCSGMVNVSGSCVAAVTGPGNVILVMEATLTLMLICRATIIVWPPAAIPLSFRIPPTPPTTPPAASFNCGTETVGSRLSVTSPSTVLTLLTILVTRFVAGRLVTALGRVTGTIEVTGPSTFEMMLVTPGMMLLMIGTVLGVIEMMLVTVTGVVTTLVTVAGVAAGIATVTGIGMMS